MGQEISRAVLDSCSQESRRREVRGQRELMGKQSVLRYQGKEMSAQMEEERQESRRYLFFPSLARPVNEFLKLLRISRKEKAVRFLPQNKLHPVYARTGKTTRLRGDI